MRELDRLAVYGRAGGLQIYELLGIADEASGSPDWVRAYEAGLASWRTREFARAIGDFEKAAAMRKFDVASSLMIERCKQQLENPAGEEWDGTTVARSK